jgi:hypothetical protein
MKMYRQGDVLLIRDDTAEGGAEIPRDKGAVVLAYGEVTGHSHAIHNPNVCQLRNEGHTVLVVEGDAVAQLVHEEHAPIELPPGRYRVQIQQEYTPEDYRNVAD